MRDVRRKTRTVTERPARGLRRTVVLAIAVLVIIGLHLRAGVSAAHAETACGEVLLEDTPEVLCISLNPASGGSPVGDQLSLIATVTLAGALDDGDPVSISVESGPNAGAHIEGLTPVSGRVILTYSGTGGPGLDTIRACIVSGSSCPVSAVATHSWAAPTATPQPTATSLPAVTPTPIIAATPTLAIDPTTAPVPSSTATHDQATPTSPTELPDDPTAFVAAEGAPSPAATPARETTSESSHAPPSSLETAAPGLTPRSEVLASGKSAPRTSTSAETSSAAELASTNEAPGTARWPWAVAGTMVGLGVLAAAGVFAFRRWRVRQS